MINLLDLWDNILQLILFSSLKIIASSDLGPWISSLFKISHLVCFPYPQFFSSTLSNIKKKIIECLENIKTKNKTKDNIET